ncbi:MAG: hypothetical protein WB783_06780 [Arenicellales bacterium]
MPTNKEHLYQVRVTCTGNRGECPSRYRVYGRQQPTVTIRAGGDMEHAGRLHERAHELCFIARSVNFRVSRRPRILAEE